MGPSAPLGAAGSVWFVWENNNNNNRAAVQQQATTSSVAILAQVWPGGWALRNASVRALGVPLRPREVGRCSSADCPMVEPQVGERGFAATARPRPANETSICRLAHYRMAGSVDRQLPVPGVQLGTIL